LILRIQTESEILSPWRGHDLRGRGLVGWGQGNIKERGHPRAVYIYAFGVGEKRERRSLKKKVTGNLP